MTHLVDVFDVDAVGSGTVFEDDLLQEHERSLVLCMLPHLYQQGINKAFTRTKTVQQRHPQVTDGLTGVQILFACKIHSRLLLKQSDHPQCRCPQQLATGKAACKKLGAILARRQSRCLGLLLP